MGFDITWLVFVLPAFILSIAAQILVQSSYRRMSKICNSRHISGEQAALAVLRYYGITNVPIEECAGKLSDHFDPRSNVIRLSSGVYHVTSISAVGIACHEAGHAAQYADNYAPILWRNRIAPVCNVCSYIGIPLALVGYYLGFEPLIYIGLCLYTLIALFQLITLPVELNASNRALCVIEETGLLDRDENRKAAVVLRCAALTYVASLAVTLGNLMRFIVIFLGGRRRK